MDNKQRWKRLPWPAWFLWLIVTVGTCAANNSPPVSDDSPAKDLSIDDTGYISSTDVSDVLAALPDIRAKQLVITASSLPREELPRIEQLYRQALHLMANEADERYRWGVLYLLSTALRNQNRALEAKPLIRAAYEIAHKYHSPDSMAVLHTTNALAWDSVKTDRATAVKLALQAEQLIERNGAGRQPLELMLDRLMVGDLLFGVEELERSEKLLLLVLKDPGLARLHTYKHARLLNQLGMISDEGRRTAQAISYLNQALVLWAALEDMTPQMHREMGDAYSLLGYLWLELKEPARAKQQLLLAVEQFKMSRPENDAQAHALCLLGNTLLGLNHYKQARDVLAQAYEFQKKNGSAEVFRTAWIYGRALAESGDYSEAASVFHDAQLGYQKMRGRQFDAAIHAYQRGRALQFSEQFCEARKAFEEARKLLQEMPMEKRTEVSELQAAIAKVQNSDAKRVCTQ